MAGMADKLTRQVPPSCSCVSRRRTGPNGTATCRAPTAALSGVCPGSNLITVTSVKSQTEEAKRLIRPVGAF